MLEEFDRLWKLLAANGHCDELGGAEYQRVKNTFEWGGCAVAITRFICREANRDASVSQITEEVQRVLNNSLTVANEEIVRLKKEKEVIVATLRAFVEDSPGDPQDPINDMRANCYMKARQNAEELLRVIDAQKTT